MEELKLIIDAINGIASGAGTLAGWLIFAHYGTKVIFYIALVAIFVSVIVGVYRFHMNLDVATLLCKDIAGDLGMSYFYIGSEVSRDQLRGHIREAIAARDAVRAKAKA